MASTSRGSRISACSTVVALVLATAATALSAHEATLASTRPDTDQPVRRTGSATSALPLAGKVIVIDPGHQLGNSRYPEQISRLVNAGGFYKACNTTGTATNAGYPEATFNWRTAVALRYILRGKGATVYLTRNTNSYDDWGPCIDVRGRTGNRRGADAVVSLHGDGSPSTNRGFFVIRPALRSGWTDDIYRRSARLAKFVKGGLVRAGAVVANNYGGDGFDVRGDLGTLNWSDVPIVMIELGNMRNSTDAQRMTSKVYRRHVYARGLATGLQRFILR